MVSSIRKSYALFCVAQHAFAQSIVQIARNEPSHSSSKLATILKARGATSLCDGSKFYCKAPETCFTGPLGGIGCCSETSCADRICVPFTSGFTLSCDYSTGGCVYCPSTKPYCGTITNVLASQYLAMCMISPLSSTVSYANSITGSVASDIAPAMTATPASPPSSSTPSSTTTITSTTTETTYETTSTSYNMASALGPTSVSSSDSTTTSESPTSDASTTSPGAISVDTATPAAVTSTSQDGLPGVVQSTTPTKLSATPASSSSSTSTSTSSPKSSISSPGVLVGIVLGSAGGTALVLLLLYCFRKRLTRCCTTKRAASNPYGQYSASGTGDEQPDSGDDETHKNEKGAAHDTVESPLTELAETQSDKARQPSYPGQPLYRVINPEMDVQNTDSISPIPGYAEAPADRPMHSHPSISSVGSPLPTEDSSSSMPWMPSPLTTAPGRTPTTPDRSEMDGFTQRDMSGSTQRKKYIPYTPSVYTAGGQPPASLAPGWADAPSLPQEYSLAELDGQAGKGRQFPSIGRNSDRDTPWRYLSAEEALSGGWRNGGKG